MEKGGFSEMVLIRRALEADFIFTADEYADELRVLRFNNVEGISEPFRYNLKLAAQDPEIDYGTIVGKSACLTVYGETGERYFNGIVTRLIQGAIGSRFTVYHAELMPKIWLLTMRHGCRIFQNKTVQEIITQIFQDAEIESDRYRFALQGTHNSREYCVQYRESEFNFMSRLMEEEGIFYFFEHDEDKHVMVIADSSAIHTPIESPDIVFNEPSNMVQDKESIFQYRFYRQARPGSTSLRDFNYERPTMGLDVMALSGAGDESFEIYDYPGLYQDQGTGADIAQMRLESLRSNLEVGSGQSVCRRFMPGYRFRMTRHARTSFNQEYLITRLTSSGSQPLGEDSAGGEGLQYSNDFECIPFSVPYRPLRKTPKPIVEGVQTAIVVGPSGDDIYFDDLGRVKVQFHWDRENQNDENSSCWIRVSDGYAGQNHGIQFTPLIGDEVIVDFLEGDPDRPIIIGRVYNGDNIPHLEPQNKVQNQILTPYQHKLLFDDKRATIALTTGGSQQIHMTDGGMDSPMGSHITIRTSDNHQILLAKGSENDLIMMKTGMGHQFTMDDMEKQVAFLTTDGHTFILDDKNKMISVTSTAGHYITIDDNAGTITVCDSSGQHQIQIADSGQKITIEAQTGDIEIKAPSGAVNISAGEITLQAGNIKIKADNEVSIEAGSKITEKSAQIELSGSQIKAQGGMTEISGGTVKVQGAALVDIKGALVKINS
jgi:type VI secretion system secreted protein VgrG